MGQPFNEDELKRVAWLRKLSDPKRFEAALALIVKMKKHFGIEVADDTVHKLLPQCQ